MHTLCSDGIYEVETVVDMAVNNGILAMAVTDHDTLAGIGRARQRCQGRSPFICSDTGLMKMTRLCVHCSPAGRNGLKPSTGIWQRR